MSCICRILLLVKVRLDLLFLPSFSTSAPSKFLGFTVENCVFSLLLVLILHIKYYTCTRCHLVVVLYLIYNLSELDFREFATWTQAEEEFFSF